jgi:hypothetical protein
MTFGCVNRTNTARPTRVRMLQGTWKAIDRKLWNGAVYGEDAFKHDFCKYELVLDREGRGTITYGPTGAKASVEALQYRGIKRLYFRRTRDGHLPPHGVMQTKFKAGELDIRLTYEDKTGAKVVEHFHRRKKPKDDEADGCVDVPAQ